MTLEHEETTGQIIGAAFEVYRLLGYGFLEKVYQRAMHLELSIRGIQAQMEAPIVVCYKGAAVGDYRADLYVADSVIVEIKAAKSYNPEHEPQLLNELKATGVKVGLHVNFGRTQVEFKRMVF